MIYACDSCKFVFEHVGEEKQEYIEYQKEKNKHLL